MGGGWFPERLTSLFDRRTGLHRGRDVSPDGASEQNRTAGEPAGHGRGTIALVWNSTGHGRTTEDVETAAISIRLVGTE